MALEITSVSLPTFKVTDSPAEVPLRFIVTPFILETSLLISFDVEGGDNEGIVTYDVFISPNEKILHYLPDY